VTRLRHALVGLLLVPLWLGGVGVHLGLSDAASAATTPEAAAFHVYDLSAPNYIRAFASSTAGVSQAQHVAARVSQAQARIAGFLAAEAADRVPWLVTKLPGEEEDAVLATLQRIDAGTKPTGALGKQWGSQFKNYKEPLPGAVGAASPYSEYRVAPPPGASGAGTRRLVVDSRNGAVYYTSTHYFSRNESADLRRFCRAL
jgi:guanyl-specific ribonuclease Sa